MTGGGKLHPEVGLHDDHHDDQNYDESESDSDDLIHNSNRIMVKKLRGLNNDCDHRGSHPLRDNRIL